MVEAAQWANVEQTIVNATIGGVEWLGIRMDEQNELQREVQRWLADGGVPDPMPPKVVATLDSVDTGKTTAEILGAS